MMPTHERAANRSPELLNEGGVGVSRVTTAPFFLRT